MSLSKKKKISVFVIGSVGIICLVAGIVLIGTLDSVIHSQIAKNLPLTAEGETFKQWRDWISPMYFQVWVFDIVNPLEILDGKTPAVVQRGPYTYRENRQKYNITFYDNGTASYREFRDFEFDLSKSVGSENDTVTTINLPLVTVMSLLRYEYEWFNALVDGLFEFEEETIFMELSVYDLLWGYEDRLLKTAMDLAEEYLNMTLPIPDKVGFLMGDNDTDSGEFLVYSGSKDLDKLADVITWNGQKKLSYWTSDFANTINGTMGLLFPPFLNKEKPIHIFSTDLTRSIGMNYEEEKTVRDITVYKYVAPPSTFANPSVNPANAGFCTPPGNCLPSGLLNISNSRFGAPIVISNPHFLHCDKDIIDSVEGLKPNKKLHESYLSIEPMTGVNMLVEKMLQVNVHLQKVPGFKATNNLSPRFLPVFWLNENAKLTQGQADQFKTDVLDMITLTKAVKYNLVALGSLLILVALCILLVCNHEQSKANNGVIVQTEDPSDSRTSRNREEEPLLGDSQRQ